MVRNYRLSTDLEYISVCIEMTHYIIYFGVVYYLRLEQNSYPMKEWHVKHMENTLVKFVTGLSEDASRWEKRINNKYGRIGRVAKRIEYDIKHGVTAEEVAELMNKIRNDASYSEIRQNQDAIQRLDELERQLNSPKKSSW